MNVYSWKDTSNMLKEKTLEEMSLHYYMRSYVWHILIFMYIIYAKISGIVVSSRFSSNSEAFASELLKILKKYYTCIVAYETVSNLQLHNSLLSVSKNLSFFYVFFLCLIWLCGCVVAFCLHKRINTSTVLTFYMLITYDALCSSCLE